MKLRKATSVLLALLLVLSFMGTAFAEPGDIYNKADKKMFKAADQFLVDEDAQNLYLADLEAYYVMLKDFKLYLAEDIANEYAKDPANYIDNLIASGKGIDPILDLEVLDISAIGENELLVQFSMPVDAVDVSNFTVVADGGNKVVTSAKLEPNKKEAIITVQGLTYNMNGVMVTVKGVKATVNSKLEEVPEKTLSVDIPTADKLYNLRLVGKTLKKKAFPALFEGSAEEVPYMLGKSDISEIITAQVVNAKGYIARNVKGIIVAQKPKLGKYTRDSIALENGEANFVLQSSTVTADTKLRLVAQIQNSPTKPLEGKEAVLDIVLKKEEADDSTAETVFLEKVIAEQADRFDLVFSGPITVTDIVSAFKLPLEDLVRDWNTILQRAKTFKFNLKLDNGADIENLEQIDEKTIRVIMNADGLNHNIEGGAFTGSKSIGADDYVFPETKKNNIVDLGATAFANTSAPNVLLEDSHFQLEVVDNIISQKSGKKVSVAKTTSSIPFHLDDNKPLETLGVEVVDNKIIVEFTEAVAEDHAERVQDIVDGGKHYYVSQNFKFNGRPILVAANGKAPSVAERTFATAHNYYLANRLYVGIESSDAYNTTDLAFGDIAKDERHYVSIIMSANQAIDKNKSYPLQIANVTDWAGLVDPKNVAATQTFSVMVDVKAKAPTWEVIKHSPEQYLIAFSTPIESFVDPGTMLQAKAKDIFKVSIDGTALKYDDDYQVRVLADADTDVFTASGAASIAPNDVVSGQYFLIETHSTPLTEADQGDWTAYFKTDASLKNYYTPSVNPIVFTISNVTDGVEPAKNKNTKTNSESIVLAVDEASPVLVDAKCGDVFKLDPLNGKNGVVALAEGQSFYVKTNEPVKLNLSAEAPPFTPAEGLTPSQKEKASGGVNVPTFEFDKEGKIIKGKLAPGSVHEDDMSFVIQPEAVLEEGTWTVRIKNLTDDVGNGAETRVFTVVVKAPSPIETKFQVEWAAFDNNEEGDPTSSDYLYIKFTKPVDPSIVSHPDYFALGFHEIPPTSNVTEGIPGLDLNPWEGITIQMPRDTWNGDDSDPDTFQRNLVINPAVVSQEGEKLPKEKYLLEDTTTAVADPFEEKDMAFEAIYKIDGVFLTTFRQLVLMAETVGNVDGKADQIRITANWDTADIDYIELANKGQYKHSAGNFFDLTPGSLATTAITTSAEEVFKYDDIEIKLNNPAYKKIYFIGLKSATIVDACAPIAVKAELDVPGLADNKLTVTFSEEVAKNATPTTIDATAVALTSTNGASGNPMNITSVVDPSDAGVWTKEVKYEVADADNVLVNDIATDFMTLVAANLVDHAGNTPDPARMIQYSNAWVKTGIDLKTTVTQFAANHPGAEVKNTHEQTIEFTNIPTSAGAIGISSGSYIFTIAVDPAVENTVALVATKVYDQVKAQNGASDMLTFGATQYKMTDDGAGTLTFTAQTDGALPDDDKMPKLIFTAGSTGQTVTIDNDTNPGETIPASNDYATFVVTNAVNPAVIDDLTGYLWISIKWNMPSMTTTIQMEVDKNLNGVDDLGKFIVDQLNANAEFAASFTASYDEATDTVKIESKVATVEIDAEVVIKQ